MLIVSIRLKRIQKIYLSVKSECMADTHISATVYPALEIIKTILNMLTNFQVSTENRIQKTQARSADAAIVH